MDSLEIVVQIRLLEQQRLAAVFAAVESFSSDVSSLSNERPSFLFDPPDPEMRQVTTHSDPAAVALMMAASEKLSPSSNIRAFHKASQFQAGRVDVLTEEMAALALAAAGECGRQRALSSPGALKRRYRDRLGRAAGCRQVVIGYSDSGDDLVCRRALESGVDFILPKPFSLEQFVETALMLSPGAAVCPGDSQRGGLPHQHSAHSGTSATTYLTPSINTDKFRTFQPSLQVGLHPFGD